jgi:hypothetical protein
MKLSLTLILLFLLMGYPASSYACRLKNFNTLGVVSDPKRNVEVLEVFVGEIVGVRNPDRLEGLKRCRPRVWKLQDPEGDEQVLDCLESDPDIDLEVYPTEVIKGRPKFPTAVRATGCTRLAPRGGSEALVLRTSSYSIVLVFSEDEPDYPHSYSDEYLRKVRECITGECSARSGE